MQLPEQRTRQIVNRLFKEYKIQPHIKLQTRNISAGAELVSQAATWPVLCLRDPFETYPADPAGPRFSVGSPNTTVDFVAAYRKGSYLPYHAQEYIKIVKDFT